MKWGCVVGEIPSKALTLNKLKQQHSFYTRIFSFVCVQKSSPYTMNKAILKSGLNILCRPFLFNEFFIFDPTGRNCFCKFSEIHWTAKEAKSKKYEKTFTSPFKFTIKTTHSYVTDDKRSKQSSKNKRLFVEQFFVFGISTHEM